MKHSTLMIALAVSVGMFSVVQAAPQKWWIYTPNSILKKKFTISPSVCGNGVKTGTEECDDGNAVNTDSCTNLCKTAKCGDGVIKAGVEECDDGNFIHTDSCTNLCKPAKCGDGAVQAGVDECDDGNTTDTDSCTNLCKPAKCGDGAVQAGVEECDDGNTVDADSCSNLCKIAPQIFTVNNASDAVDDDVGKGGCHTAENVCTLRAAIQEANATSAQDEIIVPAGKYTLTLTNDTEGNGENDVDASQGDLDIKEPLTITGAGAEATTVIAGGSFDDRLFHSKPATNGMVTLSGLTLDGNNIATGVRGAVVFFKKTADSVTGIIDGCHVKNGNGTAGGGVGMNDALTVMIKNSTISNNTGSDRGAGFFCETGTCVVINSTFSANTNTGTTGGGGIGGTTGTLTIIHSTFVNNAVTDATANGGGVNFTGTTSMKNSVLAGNTVSGSAKNCGDLGTFSSGGYNISDDASCTFAGTGDQNSAAGAIVNTTLANNGGKTPTHLIPNGSPAIDLVPADSCTDKDGGALTTDQRGVARPADGNKDAVALCDAGAVEMSN